MGKTVAGGGNVKVRAMNPRERLLRLITGYWVSQLIYAAVKLKIADVLLDGPLPAIAVARRVKTPPELIQRLMYALVDVGIFACDRQGRFRLTRLGELLRTGPDSMQAVALLLMAECNWKAFGSLTDAVASGESPFDYANGMPVYEYLSQDSELEKLLSELQGGSGAANESIARVYPFGRFRRIVDVGGSGGELLIAILERHRRVAGVLFDQPQVIEHARTHNAGRAGHLRDRLELVGGDFLDSVPEGADAYLLRFVLHNWNDPTCVRILRNCRRAMKSNGTALVIDHLLKPGNGRDYTRINDIGMFALTGGQERSKRHYSQIMAEAGLKVRRVFSARSPLGVDTPLSILEATPMS
jgi:hypothetical protein